MKTIECNGSIAIENTGLFVASIKQNESVTVKTVNAFGDVPCGYR